MTRVKAGIARRNAVMTQEKEEVTKKLMGAALRSFGLTKEQGLMGNGPGVSHGC